jgi:hypothetical protein
MSTQKQLPAVNEIAYDYTLSESGDRKIINSSEELALYLKQKLQFYQGEWAFDITVGLPWTQLILEKPLKKNLVDSLVKAAIIGTPNVVELVSYFSEYFPSERRFSIDFRYTDTFSQEQQGISVTI